MMKLYGYHIKCNGTKIMSFNSEQFLKVKGTSAMIFLWQGVCCDMKYSEYTPGCSCVVHTLAMGTPCWLEIRTCTTAVPHHFGSELTPCEYILAHIAVSIMPLQPGCWWRKPRYAAALEETLLSDMVLGPGERQATGRKNIAENRLNYLQSA